MGIFFRPYGQLRFKINLQTGGPSLPNQGLNPGPLRLFVVFTDAAGADNQPIKDLEILKGALEEVHRTEILP